jgi:hypothetical protein
MSLRKINANFRNTLSLVFDKRSLKAQNPQCRTPRLHLSCRRAGMRPKNLSIDRSDDVDTCD